MSQLDLFITATDTDAGKTYVAVELTKSLVNLQKKVAVYKPISAGCDEVSGQLINEDAKLLLNASNCKQSYAEVNPIAFKEPMAPHIAAKLCNQTIDADVILNHFNHMSGDINIVEGAGGWRLPLGNGQFLSDLAVKMQTQVILVVNMKLGCLNHAVLTYQSILSDGLNCIGWIANNQENMPFLAENIEELKQLIDAPCLGQININDSLDNVAQYLISNS